MLATVLQLVEEIEGDFEVNLGPGEFAHVREGLFRIADRIDPVGALGAGDVDEAEGVRRDGSGKGEGWPANRSSG